MKFLCTRDLSIQPYLFIQSFISISIHSWIFGGGLFVCFLNCPSFGPWWLCCFSWLLCFCYVPFPYSNKWCVVVLLLFLFAFVVSTFLLSGLQDALNSSYIFPAPALRISHFSNDIWFLLLENFFRNQIFGC